MPKPRIVVRLSINETGSGQREVLQVLDRGDNEIILVSPSPAINMRGPIPYATKEDVEKKIAVENRVSIHPSPDSPKNINMITKTIRTAEEAFPKLYLFTSTIKSKNGHQPIVARRHPRMNMSSFDFVAGNEKTVCIGKYDPKHLQLITQIFVSHRSVDFDIVIPADIWHWHCIVSNYRITILASFLKFPAHQGNFFEVFTKDPGPDFPGPFGHALSTADAIDDFKANRLKMVLATMVNHPDALPHQFYREKLLNPKFCKKYLAKGFFLDCDPVIE